jgi:hypothetical protein
MQVSLPGGDFMASPEHELAIFIFERQPGSEYILFIHFANLVPIAWESKLRPTALQGAVIATQEINTSFEAAYMKHTRKASLTVEPSSSGLFLYGIIPTGENTIFNVAGAGADFIDVFTVPIYYPLSSSPREQGIAGVVSASPCLNFHSLTHKEAEACQATHQQVISAVMQFFPILPVRCGTILSCELEVSELLSQHNNEFQAALEKIRGRSEMEITVTWDLKAVLQEIEQQDAILFARDLLAGCVDSETATRIRALDNLVKTSLDLHRNLFCRRFLPTLQEITSDIAVSPLVDDHTVLQAALLLDRDSRRALEQRLEAVSHSYMVLHHTGGPALKFSLAGPFPPNHFATFDVQSRPFFKLPAQNCGGQIGSQSYQLLSA